MVKQPVNMDKTLYLGLILFLFISPFTGYLVSKFSYAFGVASYMVLALTSYALMLMPWFVYQEKYSTKPFFFGLMAFYVVGLLLITVWPFGDKQSFPHFIFTSWVVGFGISAAILTMAKDIRSP